MRRLLLFITLVVSLTSCEYLDEYYYCPYCHRYYHTDYCGYCGSYLSYGYKNDFFCADKLLGTWQADYGCIVNGYEIKEIKFFDNNTCDMVLAEVNSVDWYSYTFTYSYYGNNIKFTRKGSTIIFHIKGYIFPELYLEDSFGRYTWRKVRAYGC